MAGWSVNPRQMPSAMKTTNGASRSANRPTDPSPTAGAPRRFQQQQKTTTASDQAYPCQPDGQARIELAEVENEDGRVNRHVEDAGREREPPLLVSPEGTESATHPDVKATLGGNGAGQFADHERRRQRPENRQDKKNDDGARKSGAAEDVLNAVWPA